MCLLCTYAYIFKLMESFNMGLKWHKKQHVFATASKAKTFVVTILLLKFSVVQDLDFHKFEFADSFTSKAHNDKIIIFDPN